MESSGRIRSPGAGRVWGGDTDGRRLLPAPGQGSGPGIPKRCPVLRGETHGEEQPTLKKRKKEGKTGGKRRKKKKKKEIKRKTRKGERAFVPLCEAGILEIATITM